MADNFVKTKRHVLTDAGYKTLSQWTNANSVEMDNGNSVQTEVTNLKNIATTSANGLMSSADKEKLDTIATSANKYTHPTYTSSANGLKKITVDGTGHVSSTAAVEKTDITSLGIPAQDTTYATATTNTNGLMTNDQVIKLNSIDTSANNYTHPSYTSAASALRKFTVDRTGHVSATAAVAKADITGLGIPAQDTTYAVATTAANGLMTSIDKTKLDGIADNANNYTHPSYTSAASALRKFTVDGTGHVSATAAVAKADITGLGIPAQDTTYAAFTSAANGLVPAAKSGSTNWATSAYVLTGAGWKAGTKYNTDTTYAVATTAANGLMTSIDKTKLDGIADNANNYTHPTYTSAASGMKKFAVDDTGHVYEITNIEKADITGLGIPGSDTTYATFTSAANGLVPAAKNGTTNYATTGYVLTGAGWQAGTKYNTDNNTTYAAVSGSANGLMTSTDKTKLDSIAASANNYTHPSYTSIESGLYKVAVDGTGHVSGATAVVKDDITSLGISATDTTYATFTSSDNGLVPAAKSGTTNYATSGYVLTGAGWKAGTKYNTDNNTTYAAVTTGANGLMTSTDKTKLDAIAASANNYTHPSYTSAANNLYKVTVDGTGHVSATAAVAKADITGLGIPAQDTTYAAFTSAADGLVPAAKSGTTNYATSGYVLTGAGWKAGTKYNTDNNTTYAAVTTGANGLMTSTDKTKLDGIAAGAQVNSITGVKGNAETNYRTGNVNITPANIGAIPSSYIGANNGVAPLNASGLIDSTYLPAYVDDVLEFNGTAAFPTSGTAGIIYVDISQQENNIYRWSGTTYVVLAKNTDTTYTLTKTGNNIKLTGSNGYTGEVTDTTYAAVSGSANGLMTSTDKTKLDSIAASANNYTHPSYTSAASALRKFTVDGTGHVSATAAVAKADITGLGIPGSDTTYATFTSAANGLVPAAKNGTTNYATTGYVLTGAGWQAGTKYNTDNNTTYAAVSGSANGLMTSTDKTKLDSIAASANNYTHPSYTSIESGLYKVAVDGTGHVNSTAAVEKTDITSLGIPAQDTTYAAFTSAANGLVPAAKNGTTSYLTSGYVLTGAGWKAGTKYNTDTTYAAVTTAANGLMTSTDKTKLDSIAASANNYTHPSYTSAASALRKFTVDGTGHVSATAAVAKADITGLGIPGNDTTYANFGSGSAGLVPAPTADQATSGYVLTGTGWAAGTKYNTDTTYTTFTSAANGLVPAAKNGTTSYLTSGYVLTGAGWKAGTKYNTDNNTTYAAVTTAANGLMTSTDKTKLDGIADNANNYTHPTYTSAASGLYKVAVDGTGHVSGATAVVKDDITGLGIPAQDTTYATFTSAADGLVPAAKSGTTNYATSGYVLTGAGWKAGTKYNTDNNTTYAAVTTAANGLMTSTDKTKLDGIADNANNYTHPTYTSAASALRKFTVDGTGHVSSTAAIAKSDITGLGIPAQDTTYANFTSAASGLVPAAKNGSTNYATSAYVLTGAGWANGTKYNTDTTYANFGSGSAGLVPAPTTDQATSGYVLTGAGWQAGTKYNTDTNTTYATFTSAANGLVPAAKSGSTNYATTGYVLTGAGWQAGTKYNVDNNTTYAAVTTAANGLMTSGDKSKLDGIAAGANNYTHPTYTSAASGFYKIAVDGTGHVSGATAVAKSDITGLGIATDSTFTSAANGLVPAAKSGSTNYATTGYVLTGAGWQAGTKYNVDNNTTYATFTSAANGLVPAANNGSTSYLTSAYVLTGAGWQSGTKYNTDTTYANFGSGSAGLVPAPTATQATSGYVLTGTGWAAGAKYNTDTTYANFGSGSAGLVPAPTATQATSGYVLTGTGWAAGAKYNTDTTYATFTSAANGLVPAAKNGTTSYLTTGYVLTGAGWQAGTKYNTDTTYATATTTNAGLTKASYVDGSTLYVF